jgi:hypothetical protein
VKIEPGMLLMTPRRRPTMVIEGFTCSDGEAWWVLMDREGKFNAKERWLRNQIRGGILEVINEAR